MNKSLQITLLFGSALLAAMSLSGQVTLVTDDFGYGAQASTTGLAGGSGWTGAYSDEGSPAAIANADLVFGNAASGYIDDNSSGTGLLAGTVDGSYNGAQNFRSLATSIDGTVAQDVYFSLVARLVTGDDFAWNVHVGLNTGTSPRFGISGDKVFVRDASTSYTDGVALTQNVNWLIIGRYSINTSGANDNLEVWGFRDDTTTAVTLANLNSATADRYHVLDSLSDFVPSTISSINFVTDQDAQVDQLRIAYGGTSQENLNAVLGVPEPSTYALFLGFLALGGILLRRRLRS
ncbi:MAG: PEP-CTERM sorting domain-containing protein [Oceanipulchritudo sp.]